TTVAAFGAGAPLPAGFVTSAVALLALHPEYADGLVEIFERPHMTSKMRGLLLDILCSAGDARAQSAMRTALASASARRDPGYPSLVQRLGFVLAPDKATIDFALASYATPLSAGARAASAYALGSAVGSFARNGNAGAAAVYAERLRRDLSRARNE